MSVNPRNARLRHEKPIRSGRKVFKWGELPKFQALGMVGGLYAAPHHDNPKTVNRARKDVTTATVPVEYRFRPLPFGPSRLRRKPPQTPGKDNEGGEERNSTVRLCPAVARRHGVACRERGR